MASPIIRALAVLGASAFHAYREHRRPPAAKYKGGPYIHAWWVLEYLTPGGHGELLIVDGNDEKLSEELVRHELGASTILWWRQMIQADAFTIPTLAEWAHKREWDRKHTKAER